MHLMRHIFSRRLVWHICSGMATGPGSLSTSTRAFPEQFRCPLRRLIMQPWDQPSSCYVQYPEMVKRKAYKDSAVVSNDTIFLQALEIGPVA
jgi:hypothetical protein